MTTLLDAAFVRDIAAQTGTTAAALNTVEVIFTQLTLPSAAVSPAVAESSAFAECRSLSELCFIQCGLTALPWLGPARATLVRLVVTEQGLTSMLGLGDLPALRELHLGFNSIARVEGLTGCPAVQHLCLFGNVIEAVDAAGLTPLADLRTLALQGNRITALGSLAAAGLTRLTTLALSGNPVSRVEEVAALAPLASLVTLSLDDGLFDPAPVCCAPRYREVALAQLRSLHELDGAPVGGGERRGAEDAHLRALLAFSAGCDALRERHARRIGDLAAAGAAQCTTMEMTRSHLTARLTALEGAVATGRAGVRAMYASQRAEREAAAAALDSDLGSYLAKHAALAASISARRAADAAAADVALARAAARAAFLADECRLLRVEGGAQTIAPGGPEHALVKHVLAAGGGARMRRAAVSTPACDGGERPAGDWRLLAMYRLAHPQPAASARLVAAQQQQQQQQQQRSPSAPVVRWVLMPITPGASVVSSALHGLDPDAGSPAPEVCDSLPPPTHGGSACLPVLVCHALLSLAESAVLDARGATTAGHPDSTVLPVFYAHVTWTTGGEPAGDGVTWAAATALGASIVGDGDASAVAALYDIERAAESRMRAHSRAAAMAVDPELGAVAGESMAEVTRLMAECDALAAAIDAERAAQDTALRSFRDGSPALRSLLAGVMSTPSPGSSRPGSARWGGGYPTIPRAADLLGAASPYMPVGERAAAPPTPSSAGPLGLPPTGPRSISLSGSGSFTRRGAIVRK